MGVAPGQEAGSTPLNCLEGFEAQYAAGVRVFEVDLREKTSESVNFVSVIMQISGYLSMRRSKSWKDTMDESRWRDSFASIADEYGIKVYIHTVNDKDKAQKLLDAGVDGIYTDSLTPETLGLPVPSVTDAMTFRFFSAVSCKSSL